jgi:hypothetical protein
MEKIGRRLFQVEEKLKDATVVQPDPVGLIELFDVLEVPGGKEFEKGIQVSYFFAI